jgi:AraC family transcriptional regulator
MLDPSRGESCEPVGPPGVKDPVVFHLLMALRDELRAAGPGDRLYVESLGSALAAHLSYKYGSSSREESPRGGLAPFRLKLVKEHVDANLGRDLRLPELASLAQMNVDSFIRAFRQSVGVPPHRYILMQRVERARALLRASAFSIPQVAVRSGFGSQSSFTRAFRRLTGTTPREYRRSL